MIKYEIWYVEHRYYDQSQTWMTASDLKSISFEEADDEKAIHFAKKFLKTSSDDPLVKNRILNKLVRVIEIR